ncbi:hypothetical protein ACFXJ8_43005 [Nonomuraea sp. NPDC059194]|uniref:hypothetical protein n=1 Tax=Nonomuraea sp. NPDC059194 TaxID=3346764 RepID=UPI00368AFA10
MGNDSVLCQVCQGVLPATGREAYTTTRGRLIVTNGYCEGGCAERQPQQQPVEVVRQAPVAVPRSPGVRVLSS